MAETTNKNLSIGDGPGQIRIFKPGDVSDHAWSIAKSAVESKLNNGEFGGDIATITQKVQAEATAIAEHQQELEKDGFAASSTAAGIAATAQKATVTESHLIEAAFGGEPRFGGAFAGYSNKDITDSFAAARKTLGNSAIAPFTVAAASTTAIGGSLLGATRALANELLNNPDLKRLVEQKLGAQQPGDAATELWYKSSQADKFHKELDRELKEAQRTGVQPAWMKQQLPKEWEAWAKDNPGVRELYEYKRRVSDASAHTPQIERNAQRAQYHYGDLHGGSHGHAPTHHFKPHHAHHPKGNAPAANFALGGPTPSADFMT